jgi:hypothetical protein
MHHKIRVQMRVRKPEGLDALLVDPSTSTYPMIVHSFHRLSDEQLALLEADINAKYPNAQVCEIGRLEE